MSSNETEIDFGEFDDLDLGDLVVETVSAAEAAAAASTPDAGAAIIFDIETGPRPWPEIEQFYTPLPPVDPWSDAMVKYGNTKDKDKRAEKYAVVRAEWEAKVASHDEDAKIHRGAWLQDCALDPVTGRVLAIGYMKGDEVVIDHGDEAAMLQNFWGTWFDAAKRFSSPMVGFNIHGFDLPFLVRRSWLLNIEVPSDAMPDGRFWSRVFVDLMGKWNCGARGFVKLDRLAAYFGGPRKSGDGADFSRLYAEDQAAAIQYLAQDLRVTADVARRMGVI